MKFLHCSDLHLDSPMSFCKEPKQRQKELIDAFATAVKYAVRNGFSGVLLSGDIFDNDYCSEETFSNLVYLLNSSGMDFYVVDGNHGGKKLYQRLKLQTKENTHYFSEDSFKSYDLGGVVVYGTELNGNDSKKWETLSLQEDKYNIVILHCDVDNDKYGFFDKDKIKNANYVALGHRHSFAKTKIGNAVVCYSGVLECRGFDESSKSGFVVLDTDLDSVTFVAQGKRCVQDVKADVSEATSTMQLYDIIAEKLKKASKDNYVNLVLTGEIPLSVDTTKVYERFKEDFFAFRTEDKTTLRLDVDEIKKENGAKAVFVSLCEKLPENIAKDVLRLGLQALGGEVL